MFTRIASKGMNGRSQKRPCAKVVCSSSAIPDERNAKMSKLAACIAAASKRILSVGSGDGSQQAATVRAGHSNLVTTFYDSKAEVLRKYPPATEAVAYLESHCKVAYEIDATKLQTYNLGMFDLIFFTFPHTGVPNNDPNNVTSNQSLLREFLASATSMLNPQGHIEVTIKSGVPYDQWQLPSLLQRECGLVLSDTQPLDKSLFPGYAHRLTKGMQGSLLEVKDTNAKVYTFKREDDTTSRSAVSDAVLRGTSLSIVFIQQDSLTDKEVDCFARAILRNAGTRTFTVLDIRREFEAEIRPDTRQLNRVLYAGVKRGANASDSELSTDSEFFMILAPSGPSSKPRWRLA